MNKRTSFVVGLMVLLGAGPAAAATATCPTPSGTLVLGGTNPDTGHYFEVYKANGIGWDCANSDAEGRNQPDTAGHLVQGHLATITSSGEEEFVDSLRRGAMEASHDGPYLDQGQVWVGGDQLTDATEPGAGWQWVNSEGPFPGANTGPAYTNWASGEPNDSGGIEDHLTLGRYGYGGGWNDEGVAPGSIGGYIVEYDLPLSSACDPASSPGGCQTINGQTLVLPAGSYTPGDTIGFQTFEFTDPRVAAGTCGSANLTLFTETSYDRPELKIPPYLCGSPKFIVVAVDPQGLTFQKGTVLIENDTENVPGLQDNYYKNCTENSLDTDPQHRDVVVYQTTDPTRMLEDARDDDARFTKGAAGEFTNGCGSSRGTGKELSYLVVGMHIDFGAGSDQATHPELNHTNFVALTRYKLTLLQQSVDLAKQHRALRFVDATIMSVLLDNAVWQLDHGKPSIALYFMKVFLKVVDVARYSAPLPPDDNNYNGEHLMRGQNIAFTLSAKVIPYAP